MAAEGLEEEIKSLRRECKWVLKQEVHNVLHELHTILSEACRTFPTQITPGADAVGKPEKFILSAQTGSQHVKCVMTLMGETICEAELAMKLAKTQGVAVMSRVYPDAPWRLYQVQDAHNNLLRALSLVEGVDQSNHFSSAQQILRLLDDVTTCLNRGRSCLAMPKRKTIDELVNNPYMNCFKPALPKELSVSFYVQAQKIILSIYSLTQSPAHKLEIASRIQAECSVPWLNDVLVLFTLALQLCQQLQDKIRVFEQYEAELQTSLLRSPVRPHQPPICDNLLDLSTPSNQNQTPSNQNQPPNNQTSMLGYEQALHSGGNKMTGAAGNGDGYHGKDAAGFHGDLLDVFGNSGQREQQSVSGRPPVDLLLGTIPPSTYSNNPFHSNDASFPSNQANPFATDVQFSGTSKPSSSDVTVENLLDL